MLPDPQLSETGRQQALARGAERGGPWLTSNSIEVIVVSPFSRALRTALLAYPPESHNIPFVVTELHREVSDTSSDIGSAPATLRQTFPQVNFDGLPEEWWATDGNSKYFY